MDDLVSLAIAQGNREVINILIKRCANINVAAEEAARYGDVELLFDLLDAGANILGPYEIAASTGQTKLAGALVTEYRVRLGMESRYRY